MPTHLLCSEVGNKQKTHQQYASLVYVCVFEDVFVVLEYLEEHHKADCGMILLSYSSFVMFRKHTIPMLLALTFFLTKCQQLNVLYDNRSISLDKKKKRKESS